MSQEPSTDNPLPQAKIKRRRRWSVLWLLPIAAVMTSLGLLLAAFLERGIPIEIEFEQGHGIKPGDALRYRGIDAGSVRAVRLAPDLQSVRVLVRINPDARDLARAGSRFWIVRPQLGLSRTTGLDTVVGANYLSALPGQGDFADSFVGLEEPPLTEVMEPGGLEIVLKTCTRGSLRPGAPVSYRQVIIGAIETVELARDARSVEARVYIKPRYTPLIRANVRFWKADAVRFRARWMELSWGIDSVSSLLLGGVNLEIPSPPGAPVSQGKSFDLVDDEAEPECEDSSPSLRLYHNADFGDHQRPRPVRAVLSWQRELTWQDKLLLQWTPERQRVGWLLPVDEGFLGPTDMLTTPPDALPGSAGLVLPKTLKNLDLDAAPSTELLQILPAEHGDRPWSSLRRAQTPEDTLIVATPDMTPRFVTADRYQPDTAERWTLDSRPELDPGWHGASVVATSDGALIGVLLATEEGFSVALLPEDILD